MKKILLLFTICQAAIEKWAVKHGVTFHPEKLRWRQAAKVCENLNGHLITLDCGEKEKYVREYLDSRNVDEGVWIGLNSRDMIWNWHSSDSSAMSYVNFHNGNWPEMGVCTLMKRDHKRFWMGVRCSSKRSFICESNFIYPEVDIKKYDVGITIDNDARATVNIKVAFDELPSDEDSKDVPLTLVVPKQAVITKFNMQMGNLTFPAEITDCDNCEQNFLNSTRMGQWTTKLWRSKAITGTNFRVLTISTSICGHHETGFNLVYRYDLESNKKKSLFYFDFKLAPGTIVGHINLNLTVDPIFKARSNLAQALEPSCTVANQTPLAQRNRKKSIERNVICASSDSSNLRSPSRRFKRRNHRNKRSNKIEIGASDQRKFGEQHGLKRWIHLYLKPKSSPIIRPRIATKKSDLNFPVSPEEHETCQALLIVSKMK